MGNVNAARDHELSKVVRQAGEGVIRQVLDRKAQGGIDVLVPRGRALGFTVGVTASRLSLPSLEEDFFDPSHEKYNTSPASNFRATR